MGKFKLFTAVLVAGSVLATPTLAQQQRKTLFEVLFPKAHEQKLKKQRAKREAILRQKEQLKKITKKKAKKRELPKVETSKTYTYRVTALVPVVIKPLPVKFAAVETNTDQTPKATPQPTQMTRDLVDAGKIALRAEKHLAKTVSEHYSKNQEYYWLNEEGEWNAKARSVQKALSEAGRYGLRSADYAVNVQSPAINADDKQVAAHRLSREVAMTLAALRYAMDAEYGTINPNLLSGYHDFPVHHAKAPYVLGELLRNGLPANTIRGFHPTNEKFQALVNELTRLDSVDDDIIELPTKVLIKPGMRHLELPKFIEAIKKRGSDALLEKHKSVTSLYLGEVIYSKDLVALVRDFQKEAGLGPDGIIGRNTATRLAGVSSESRKTAVKLAMERLRWLPDEFGKRHVFINQPEYRARYIEGTKEKLSMRVVVGKKSNQTNFFYDEIEYVEYNPYWGVPRSIIVNEFLPKSISNPGYLDQQGYELSTFGGRRISSSSINWSQVGTTPNFAVRQPPGKKNALGELKIMFPNKHAIYMHDTPAKSLFNKQHRAFSHGCVRLHDPRAMAAAVLGKSRSGINAAISQGKNKTERLKSKVPVYVSYFTAWPQESGEVKYFHDIYDRDAHLLKAIKATEKARAANIPS